jgi:5-methylcytosine-specific restriction endonuclease McrA
MIVVPKAMRERYEQRINSAQWRNMRRDFMRLRGPHCERCQSGHRLELHHKTYERLGKERTSDLELLCHDCHLKADQQREQQTIERGLAARYEAGLDTYATKKYGEDSGYWPEYVAEEFDAWLERKGDE